MEKNIYFWIAACIPCQLSRSHRNLVSFSPQIPTNNGKLWRVYFNIASLYPPFCPKNTDCFMCWYIAASITDMSEETVSKYFTASPDRHVWCSFDGQHRRKYVISIGYFTLILPSCLGFNTSATVYYSLTNGHVNRFYGQIHDFLTFICHSV